MIERLTRGLRDLAAVYTPAEVLAHAEYLFGPAKPSTPVRVDDPATSQASGGKRSSHDVRNFSATSKMGQVFAAIVHASDHVDLGGLTATEAADRCSVVVDVTDVAGMETFRKRVSDLNRAYYITDSGLRRANPGGEEAVVWTVTPAGRLAYERMRDTGRSR